MRDGFERGFGGFSADWQDLTTIRGFLGGALSIAVNLVVFGLLFALAVLLDVVPPESAGSGGDGVLGLLFLLVVVGSAIVGGGWYYLFQRSDRVKRLMKTVSGRLAVQLGFYGGFWFLLTYDLTFGVFAALALVFGKAIALVGIFVAGRL